MASPLERARKMERGTFRGPAGPDNRAYAVLLAGEFICLSSKSVGCGWMPIPDEDWDYDMPWPDESQQHRDHLAREFKNWILAVPND